MYDEIQEKREVLFFKDSEDLSTVQDFRSSVMDFFGIPSVKMNRMEGWRDLLFKVRRNLADRDCVTVIPIYNHWTNDPIGITMRFGEISSNRSITEGSLVEPEPEAPLAAEFVIGE